MWDIFTQAVLLLGAGIFAVGTTIIIAEVKTKKKAENHFQKPPLTGKGQFDKQRTQYTEGDNT